MIGEEFDRDHPSKLHVLSKEHVPHSPVAQGTHDFVIPNLFWHHCAVRRHMIGHHRQRGQSASHRDATSIRVGKVFLGICG